MYRKFKLVSQILELFLPFPAFYYRPNKSNLHYCSIKYTSYTFIKDKNASTTATAATGRKSVAHRSSVITNPSVSRSSSSGVNAILSMLASPPILQLLFVLTLTAVNIYLSGTARIVVIVYIILCLMHSIRLILLPQYFHNYTNAFFIGLSICITYTNICACIVAYSSSDSMASFGTLLFFFGCVPMLLSPFPVLYWKEVTGKKNAIRKLRWIKLKIHAKLIVSNNINYYYYYNSHNIIQQHNKTTATT